MLPFGNATTHSLAPLTNSRPIGFVAWADDVRSALSATGRALGTETLIVPAGEDQTWAWFAVGEVAATEDALRSALDAARGGSRWGRRQPAQWGSWPATSRPG